MTRRLDRAASSDFRIVVRVLTDIDERFRQAWLDLERNVAQGNPFQTSSYVLAAARNLPDLSPPVLLTMESGRELHGLCVFENIAASRRLPIRHLRAWQTPHTYFDLPLLRAGSEERAMEAFWNYLLRGSHEWHGVEFPRFPNHTPITDIFERTSQFDRITCLKGTCWERATLELCDQVQNEVVQHLSIKRARSLRRGWRELEKLGEVRFEIQRDPDQLAHCAEELMHLEGLGWKSAERTALASTRSHQQFFREMVSGFAKQEDLFFTRILVNGKAGVSVVNLRAHDTAYAFKLGWDPEMERGCPGFQIKLQTALQGGDQLSGIRCIDSCSSPGSFIEHVWPGRRSLCNRVYVTSPVGHLTATMVNGLRWVRDTSRAVSRKLFHYESGEKSDSSTER